MGYVGQAVGDDFGELPALLVGSRKLLEIVRDVGFMSLKRDQQELDLIAHLGEFESDPPAGIIVPDVIDDSYPLARKPRSELVRPA